ncbi:uncharacterized protein LOC141527394 [Cotesia typhae]|uniref:uncharacterized protein LOC141527394 n=1 Tax=Cotesia typhae TaxID=2053667 RepID=UPI003D6911EE
MSLEANEHLNAGAVRKKYKLWKDSDHEVPLKTQQRWRKSMENYHALEIREGLNEQITDSDLNVNSNPDSNIDSDDDSSSDSDADSDVVSADSDVDLNVDSNADLDTDLNVDSNADSDHEENIENDTNDNDNDSNKEVNRQTFEMLYDGSDINVPKVVSYLMDLYIEKKLTKQSLQQILETLQHLLPKPNYMPATVHNLFKFVKDRAPLTKTIKHFYCNRCLKYYGPLDIGKDIDLGESKNCKICLDGKVMSYFYEYDVEDAIKFLFEHRNLAKKLKQFNRNRKNRIIEDIVDGTEYIRVNSRRNRNIYDLTLILNTDRISLSNSSKLNCWPLMFTIAELPEHLRESHLVMIGFWCDSDKKPSMNTFFRPFWEKLVTCFTKRIKWIDLITHKEFISKVVAPLFIADAPARAEIQNIQYFSGKYGCNICEIKQKRCQPVVGRKTIRIYKFTDKRIKLRDELRMYDQAEQLIENPGKLIKGVKGLSVVDALPFLDLATCVMPEYMHSVLLGVGKQFMNIYFCKKGDWNISEHLEAIDQMLLNICPPHSFHRLPRKLSLHAHYKASEIYNWILYYSIPILSLFLPKKYLDHWLLLVKAIHILLQRQIVEDDLKVAEKCLQTFVKNIEELYGDREYTYNVHQLLRLVLCVRLWGPLWATSAFSFENANGFIVSQIHGTKNIGSEVINNITIYQGAIILKNQVDSSTELDRIDDKMIAFKVSGVKKNEFLNEFEIQTFLTMGLDHKTVSIYTKANINKTVFTSQIFQKTKNDSSNVIITTKRIPSDISCFAGGYTNSGVTEIACDKPSAESCRGRG